MTEEQWHELLNRVDARIDAIESESCGEVIESEFDIQPDHIRRILAVQIEPLLSQGVVDIAGLLVAGDIAVDIMLMGLFMGSEVERSKQEV